MIERIEAGTVVVLVGEEAAEVGAAVAEAEAQGTRVAGFVGRRDAPALAEMIAALFGETPGG